MESIVRIGRPGKRSGSAGVAAEAELNVLDSRVELIQALIPLGLEAVNERLQQEVTTLARPRFQRTGGVAGYDRWGSQPGSVYLADQKVAVKVPRVREVRRDQEVPLMTYQSLRQPRRAEEVALLVVMDGAKGLRKAVDKVFGKKAAVQRCHWHKRENVLGDLPTGLQPLFQRKLSAAYEKLTYAAAKAALKRIRAELAEVNASAAASLDGAWRRR